MHNLTKSIVIVLCSLAVFMTACTSKRDKDQLKIDSLEQKVNEQAATPDTANLNQLIRDYTAFVNTYPKDSLAPLYLYRGIRVAMSMSDAKLSMKLIDKYINDYNKTKSYPEVVFLKAYVYENLMGNYGRASEIYRDFIHAFPDHELQDDAQVAIQNMGKSPEELIKEFEAKK
ncbi:MAG TPA: hypothetical protein VK172_05340 [Lentimicrobium sp.]|nr:hypothetical protein [Lentimicrobium sp.]